jgi:GDP-4-dehydro-6-deoxy-D-mannose reductase
VKVLVTGADGFVGTHLVRALRARGDDVVACAGPDTPGGLEITDTSAVQERFEQTRPDGIVHLAGVSSVSWSHQNPIATLRINVMGTANVLDAVRRSVPQARVLLIGSGEEYGRLQAGKPAIETWPLSPLSPYAASKAAVESLARQSVLSHSLGIVLVRAFNHLGAGQSPMFAVPSFARQINTIRLGEADAVVQVGDLTVVRDFTHVEDVIDAYLLLMERGTPGEVYNVCSGEGWSIERLLQKLQELAGTHAKLRVDPSRLRATEIPWLVGNPGKLENLGWRRRRSVRDALAQALEELQA